ncbi:MAG: ABC transporter permease [Anaerolineaceae bacterium]
MNKTLEVAKYEYKRHVLRRRFWVALFSVPLGIALVMLLSIYMSVSSINTQPVGYIDKAGIITQPQVLPEKTSIFEPVIPLIPYKDEASAKQSAEADEIQAYFVIPEQYTSTYRIDYYFNESISDTIRNEITALISENLMAAENLPNFDRLEADNTIILKSLDGSETAQQNDWSKIVIPLIIGVLFFMIVIFSGNYLLQAVVEEKENRTIEIMITSVSPTQLMAGKIISNISVGLTQLLAWIVLAAIVLLFFGNRIAFLQGIEISWSFLLTCLLLMLPAFVTTSALMATLGATVTDTQESQSVTGLVVIPTVLPYYFVTPIMMNPNGILARVLSYLPMSAPVAMSLRMAFTTVPTWEVIMVFGIIILFSILSVWLAGKAFRVGMLQYTKRIPLKRLFRKEAQHE